MIFLIVTLIAVTLAAACTPGGASRRLPASAIPLALWLLATRPEVPWPRTAPVSLPPGANLSEIERTLASTSPGAVIAIEGDGVHPELLPLLADRAVTWEQPADHLGLVALAWPRRVAVGEPVEVSGRLDVGVPVSVRLMTPEGGIDTTTTEGDFAFRVIPRAAGRWVMRLHVGDDTTSLGIDVVPPPRLRVLVIAGRPEFEAPALVRRLSAQDADVTVRTQMTRDRRRTERFGLTPVDPQLTSANLDSLDLVVLAANGASTLTGAEQRELAAAVDRGLGLLHLAEGPIGVGPLTPFPLRASGREWDAALTVDRRIWPGVARVAALDGPDSLAYLRDTTGRALGWRVRSGRGVVAATALTRSHRLTLAGHPESEAAWWSGLIGPVLRAPTGRWTVPHDALIRVDEPVTLAWSGEPEAVASVQEHGTSSAVRLIRGTGNEPSTLRIWPRDTGWISVAASSDTLHLLVSPGSALVGVDRAARRSAVAQRARVAPGQARGGRIPFPTALGALVLLAAIAAAWRPR